MDFLCDIASEITTLNRQLETSSSELQRTDLVDNQNSPRNIQFSSENTNLQMSTNSLSEAEKRGSELSQPPIQNVVLPSDDKNCENTLSNELKPALEQRSVLTNDHDNLHLPSTQKAESSHEQSQLKETFDNEQQLEV
jgi:hypothetical protein